MTTPSEHPACPTTALSIETWPIERLKANGRQSRHHPQKQLAKIADSIRRFGFVSPVLIDSEGRVLAGMARIAAAKLVGLTELPAVIVDHLSPDERRAFVLAENRLAELGAWNKEALQLELDELATIDLDFSLELTGFSLAEIDGIRFGASAAVGDEDLPDVRRESVTEVGDVWRLGDHRLVCGDATSPDVLRTLLDDEPVRAVFTDPPYNVPIEGHVTSSKAHGRFVMGDGEMSDTEFTGFLTRTLEQIERTLVDGGLAYVCMDWRHMKNVLDAAAAAKLALINLCCWDKGAGGMGSLYRSQHELVFVLKKGRASHVNTVELGKNGRNRANVWSYPGVNGFGGDKAREREMHPTVKPLALVKDAILDCTRQGDLVLDLFGGSGTTLVAADQTGRRARVTELDPRYADVIIRRWEAAAGQEAVLQASGETFRAVSFSRLRPQPSPAVT